MHATKLLNQTKLLQAKLVPNYMHLEYLNRNEQYSAYILLCNLHNISTHNFVIPRKFLYLFKMFNNTVQLSSIYRIQIILYGMCIIKIDISIIFPDITYFTIRFIALIIQILLMSLCGYVSVFLRKKQRHTSMTFLKLKIEWFSLVIYNI